MRLQWSWIIQGCLRRSNRCRAWLWPECSKSCRKKAHTSLGSSEILEASPSDLRKIDIPVSILEWIGLKTVKSRDNVEEWLDVYCREKWRSQEGERAQTRTINSEDKAGIALNPERRSSEGKAGIALNPVRKDAEYKRTGIAFSFIARPQKLKVDPKLKTKLNWNVPSLLSLPLLKTAPLPSSLNTVPLSSLSGVNLPSPRGDVPLTPPLTPPLTLVSSSFDLGTSPPNTALREPGFGKTCRADAPLIVNLTPILAEDAPVDLKPLTPSESAPLDLPPDDREQYQPSSVNQELPVAMPVPEGWGYPFFDGDGVTEFFDYYDDVYDGYQFEKTKRLEWLPRHCNSLNSTAYPFNRRKVLLVSFSPGKTFIDFSTIERILSRAEINGSSRIEEI